MEVLRAQLKEWERQFAAEHDGRKPTHSDIRASPAIEALYIDYNRAKKAAAAAGAAAASTGPQSDQHNALLQTPLARPNGLTAPPSVSATATPTPLRRPLRKLMMFNDPTPQLQLSDSKSANEPPVTPADVARERDADAEAIQRLAEREAMRTATAATAAATTAQITSALMASTPFVIRRNSSEVSASSKPGRKSALLAMLQPTGATPSMPTAAAVLRTVPSTLGSTVSHTTAPRTTSHGGFGSPVGSPIRPPSTARMTGAETSHTPVPPAVRSASTSLLRRIASPTVKSPPLVNTTDTPEDKTGVPPDSTPAPAPQSAVIDHVEDSAVAEMAASLASKPRRKKPVVGAEFDPYFQCLMNGDEEQPAAKPKSSTGATTVSNNFRRLNLKRGGGGFRAGAKAKFSKAFKRKNHRNYIGKDKCYKCGEAGHWANACPEERKLASVSSRRSAWEWTDDADNDEDVMSEASDDNVTRPARTGRRVADDDVEKPVVRRRRTAKEPTSAKTTRAKVNTARAKKAAAVAAAVAEEDVEELGDSAEPASDDPFSFGTAAEPLTRVTRRTRKTTQTAATVDVPVVPAAATAAATVLTTGADLPPPIKTSAFTRRRPAQKRRLLNPLDSDSEADDSTPNGDASAAPADSSPAGPVTHVERSTSFLRRPPKKIAPTSPTDEAGAITPATPQPTISTPAKSRSAPPPPAPPQVPSPALPADDRLELPADWDLSDHDLTALLRQLWKFTSFRPGQEETMRRVLRQQSTLLVQSTGSGKSLCFQLPAALLSRHYRATVLVVTPLLSLVEDQIRSLPRGLRGASLNSGMTATQSDRVKASFLAGELALLYLSPETMATDWCRRLLTHRQAPRIAFACIDEAHCVSEWSHNFRPAYLRLRRVLTEQLRVHTLLALTATATRLAEASVCSHLGIPADQGVIRNFRVPAHLQLSVSRPENKLERLLHLLRNHHKFSQGAAIVYCSRQAETEHVAAYLRTHQVDAQAFHAGMTASAKAKVLADFQKGSLRAVVATIAFGMGLDIHAVRCVIHYSWPKSPENYVQEVGRAGRDGQPAFGHLFVDDEELRVQQNHVHGDAVDAPAVNRFVQTLFAPWGSQAAREAEEETSWRVAAAVAGVGAAGQALLNSAARANKEGAVVVALDVAATGQSLDMRETVVETLLASLEQLGEALGTTIEQLPSVPSSLTLVLKSGSPATKDPVLAAVLELAQTASSRDAGRRRGAAASGPNMRQLDCSGLASVARATGLMPSEVVRAVYSLWQAGHLVRVDESQGRALCLRLGRAPTLDEMVNMGRRLLAATTQLERTQLRKIEALQAMMHEALQQTPVDDVDTVSAAMDRYLRQAVEHYFDEDQADASATRWELQAAEAIGDPQYVPIRRSIRAFVERHAVDLGRLLTGRAVARICHGIASPAFPPHTWRTNPLWERYPGVDFYALRALATHEIVQYKTGS